MELIYQLSSGLHTHMETCIPDTHRNKGAFFFFPCEAILKADGKPPFITIFPLLELIFKFLGTDYITKVIIFFPKIRKTWLSGKERPKTLGNGNLYSLIWKNQVVPIEHLVLQKGFWTLNAHQLPFLLFSHRKDCRQTLSGKPISS